MVFRVKAYTLPAYQAFGAVAGDGTTIFRLFFIFFSISVSLTSNFVSGNRLAVRIPLLAERKQQETGPTASSW